ncbi:hypothetical protein ETB97_012188 [Aspergillus alliaceus]|uniref:MADS-box domain-containing protein n=1 Tax=Petromyces alliaceus TaxID=209559 RepID=A0A8H6A5J8_PETAA|nr:hypothetical protein ETB97_012188 [Aspergillus burnettii]
MDSPTPKCGEGRRRKTVFRKFRQLCNAFHMRAMVVLVDSENRQWVFKTHDDIPGVEQALRHPPTQTLDDFHLLNRNQPRQRPDTMVALQPPTFRSR